VQSVVMNLDKVLLAFAAALSLGVSAIATAWVQSRIGASGAGALAEKPDLTGHDVSPISLPASVLRLVLAGSQPSFDVDLSAFAEKLLAYVSEPSERDHAMPFRLLLPCAITIREPLSRRDR